jgi:hypothetical protein
MLSRSVQIFLRKFERKPGILSGEHCVPRLESRFARLYGAHFDSQTEAKQLASFLAKFFGKNLARTGIEPATQGFSVPFGIKL